MSKHIKKLFADFPHAAQILIVQYMAHWKIYPIECLLFASYIPSMRTGTHIEIIPRDMLRTIMRYVQDLVILKSKNGDGAKFSICGYEHRLDSGPTTVFPFLTEHHQYGAPHRTGGHPAIISTENNSTSRYWMEYGMPARPHNFPTAVTSIYVAGEVELCRANWIFEQNRTIIMYRTTPHEYTKMWSINGNVFIASTSTRTGECTFSCSYS